MSTNQMREKHPVIPHLSRARTPATDLWPWLRKEPPRPRAKQSGELLADAKRGAISPLGGVGVSEGKGKR
jgi:hypothetical protein